MDLFLVLSLCCLALGETVKAENYLDTIPKDNGIFSTYYIPKEHHYLDLASLASFLLKDPLHCAFRCSKIEKCHSLNLSAHPNEYGYYICDLLSSSTLVYPEQLKPNVHYHHYEIKTPCLNKPCASGGTCVIAKYERESYQCICNSGYTGKKCDKDVNECSAPGTDLPCHVKADCINTVGSFYCKCEPGYVSDGKNCTKDLEKSAILTIGLSYVTELDTMLAPVKSNSSRWRLCWRGKTDGWLASTFHSKCDNKGATVTVIQVGVYVFGGYVDKSWNGGSGWKSSSKAFLFSLKNYDNRSPFKMHLITPGIVSKAIWSRSGYGPIFGYAYAINIADNAGYNNKSITNPGQFTYQLPLTYVFGTLNAQRLLTGSDSKYFTPTDLEVFYESFE